MGAFKALTQGRRLCKLALTIAKEVKTMKEHTRQKAAVRKDAIIKEAMRLSEATNYDSMKRKDIAEALGVSPQALTHHFGTMDQLKRAVMRTAVMQENLTVIAQGIVQRDEHAKKAPEALQQRALDSFKRLV